MKLTEKQYALIKDAFPRQRGNVSISNLQVLNAILYIAENGCKWHALPKRFGNWNTIYVRMNRWFKNGVLAKVFEALQRRRIISIKIEVAPRHRTVGQIYSEGTSALKETERGAPENMEASGQQKFIWLPQMPSVQSPYRVPKEAAQDPGALPASVEVPLRESPQRSEMAP